MLRITYFILLLFSGWNVLWADHERFNSQIAKADVVREKMNQINSKDRLILKDLFRSFFRKESFAYTLFGPKPMSGGGANLGFVDSSTNKYPQNRALIDFMGWKAWQKYEHLFPSQHFYFDTPHFSDTPEHLAYNIMNKQRCLEVIIQHLILFQECMGKQKTAAEIFEIVCSPSLYAYQDRKNYITCLGILFGYGKKNSQACEKRNVLLIQALYQAPYHLEGLHERMKSKQGYFHMGLQEKSSIDGLEQPLSIQSVIEGLNELQQIYHPFALVEKSGLCPIGNVRCAGMVDDLEAKALQSQYEGVYQKLVDIYNSENFLELVLIQLSS